MRGVCKICGCTKDNACIHPHLGPCWWVDDKNEVCSYCAAFPDNTRIERPKDRVEKEKERLKLTVYVIPGMKSMDELIADAFGVRLSEIHTIDRKSPGKDARFFAMWYLKKNTNLSLAEIGSRYKGRDHCTVMHACKKVDSWLKTDKVFISKANKAFQKLKLIAVK